MRTSDVTKRYLRVYDSAAPETIEAGLGWYDYAKDAAQSLRAGTPYSVEQTAAVIAVLSPRMTWAKNLSAAQTIIDEHMMGNRDATQSRGGGLMANMVKAYRILDGDMSALTGPKVTAFYQNIMGDPEAVTADSWMLLAALGEKWERGKMGEDVSRKWMPSVKERKAIIGATRSVAERRGVTPAQAQAIIWAAYRGRSY